MVSRLAAASAKWKGMKTTPGLALEVTRARNTSDPRREVTRAGPPSGMPRRAASAGLISMSASG